MNIQQFFDDYKVKRNPIELMSPYDNRMIEPDGETEYEIEGECPTNHLWTIIESEGRFKIIPGIKYRDSIGHFISSKPWNDRKLIIEID